MKKLPTFVTQRDLLKMRKEIEKITKAHEKEIKKLHKLIAKQQKKPSKVSLKNDNVDV